MNTLNYRHLLPTIAMVVFGVALIFLASSKTTEGLSVVNGTNNSYNISMNLNSSSYNAGDMALISGQIINLLDTTAIANNQITYYLDGEQIGASQYVYENSGALNTSWPYRKAITINGSTTEQTNYQVLITLTDSNFDFSKANAEGNDTRLTWLNTTSGFEQNVSFWIENWTASGANGNATIWVTVPNVTASNVANTTLYMYYGNPSAASASNGSATFMLDKTFSGEGLGGMSEINYSNYAVDWQWASGGSAVEDAVNGELDLSASSNPSYPYNTQDIGYITDDSLQDFVYQVKVNSWSASMYNVVYPLWISQADNDDNVFYSWIHNTGVSDTMKRVSDAETSLGYGPGNPTNKYYRILKTGQLWTTQSSDDGISWITMGNSTISDWSEASTWRFGVVLRPSPGDPYNQWTVTESYDYIRVRKYASPEPSVLSVGAEEAANTTNAVGRYNYTFTVPPTPGIHTIKINLTDANGGYGENSTTFTVLLQDTNPPVISGQQNGIVINTTSAILSVTTNEPATCRYGTGANTLYDAMASPTTMTDMIHTWSLTGLANGDYTYYIRCMDASGNQNTVDYSIPFSVNVPAPSPVSNLSFYLSMDSSGDVEAGKNKTTDLKIKPLSDSEGIVELSCDYLPQGVSCIFRKSVINITDGNTKEIKLTFATSKETIGGRYNISVKGTNGGITKSANYLLKIKADEETATTNYCHD